MSVPSESINAYAQPAIFKCRLMDTGCSMRGFGDICSDAACVKIIKVIKPETATEPVRCGVQIGVAEELEVDATSRQDHPAFIALAFLKPEAGVKSGRHFVVARGRLGVAWSVISTVH